MCFSNSYLRSGISLLAGYAVFPIFAAGFVFENTSLRIIEESPEKNTGLDKIYVCYDMTNVDILYKTDSPSQVKIYSYSNLGGAYSEELRNVEYESDAVRIKNASGDLGYIVEDAGNRYYYWVVNYLPHRFRINSIEAGMPDCEASYLSFNGEASPINYFTINGQQRVLGRGIKIAYETQKWVASDLEYVNVSQTNTYDSLSENIRISPAAYCSTAFHITGDKFLQAWNWGEEYETIVINPTAITAHTEVEQNGDAWQSAAASTAKEKADKDKETAGGNSTSSDNSSDDASSDNNDSGWVSNQIKGTTEGLGGSAPVEIEFRAYTSEGVIHHEWQMSSDSEFNVIDNRFNQQNFDYTFMDEGTFYIRYVGSNSDGSCEAIGDTYTVSIGASELLCPNAFSPNGDGINDEWKVSYRSIIEFKCWIFDRYGAQLYYFDNPEMGWDGKRGGKYVKPGVYYYVIQAQGSDGKKYKLDGDINIIRHSLIENNTQTTE